MIQRIQTVYMLVAAFILALLFSNPIAEIILKDNNFLSLWHNGIVSSERGILILNSNWSITVLLSFILFVQVIAIFLYKKRPLQIRLCTLNCILMIGLLGLVYFRIQSTFSSMGGLKSVYLWPVVCPMIAAILNYLAIVSIRKDEKLVRSYERIR